MLELLLQDRFRVVSFANGEAALAGLRDETPDLFIIDINMPHLDGEQLVGFCKRRMPGTAAVAFTGFTDRKDRILAAGFDAVIQKPEIDLLVEAVLKLTSRSKRKAS
jgi:two-component system KDP operon response regulator KdpE